MNFSQFAVIIWFVWKLLHVFFACVCMYVYCISGNFLQHKNLGSCGRLQSLILRIYLFNCVFPVRELTAERIYGIVQCVKRANLCHCSVL